MPAETGRAAVNPHTGPQDEASAGALAGVRPSPIAGQWYPGDYKRLADQVDGYLESVDLPEISGEVVAVMAPHAGIVYSGPVAAHAFATMRGLTPELIAVVSPMHFPYRQTFLTTSHRAYATPLGIIPVDQEALQELDDRLYTDVNLNLTRLQNDPEHSLEIELPFLQRILKNDFSLLPVMVRDPRLVEIQALGDVLATVLRGRNAVIVASTDLSHFYSQRVANTYDAEFLRQVEKFDPQAVLAVEEQGKGFACGRSALAVVMWASLALGATDARVLRYATSGDVSGDFDRVVGYAAAVFTRKLYEGNELRV